MEQKSPFRPFNTLKASEVVYNQIKSKILNGELIAGQKLPSENELAHIFQRSRPTVREALRMLESNRYITIHRGSGAIVNAITTYEIERCLEDLLSASIVEREDILFVRNVCEALTAGWAAQNRTDEDIALMQDILKSSREQKFYQELLPFNELFHKALSKASGNRVIMLVNDITNLFVNEKHKKYFETLGPEENAEICATVVQQHETILNAVVAKDEDTAVSSMKAHLLASGDTL